MATANYLKEDIGFLWEQETKSAAEQFLNQWIKNVTASKIVGYRNSLVHCLLLDLGY